MTLSQFLSIGCFLILGSVPLFILWFAGTERFEDWLFYAELERPLPRLFSED